MNMDAEISILQAALTTLINDKKAKNTTEKRVLEGLITELDVADYATRAKDLLATCPPHRQTHTL
jgi:hypothetical protein